MLRKVITAVVRTDPLQNQWAITSSAATVIAQLAGHVHRSSRPNPSRRVSTTTVA
jgi:hypothetical protein